jgi:protein tyrosine/serine phosphatase
VQQTYLDGVLDHIDATWGSMDNYLQRGLGLTASARLHLQETLLES